MGIIVLLAQKIKFHLKKKTPDKNKKQFHHYKVRYFMQSIYKNKKPWKQKTSNPTTQQTESYSKYCHANIVTTI